MDEEIVRLDWEDVGIPHGYAFPSLTYWPPTGQRILRVWRKDSAIRRILILNPGEEKYRVIGTPQEDISFDDPIVAGDPPVCFFNSEKWIMGGGFWEGIYRCDLSTLAVTLVAADGEPILPEGYERFWPVTLLSADPGRNAIYLIGGLTKASQHKVDHYICTLSIETKEVVLVQQLFDAFL